jgi:DNA-binding IclR family transcriptional regulator
MARQPGAESGRRVFAILFCFTEAHPVWTVADLATTSGVPASSVYRYVSLLREEGILDLAGPGAYRVTDRIMSLADAARAGQAPLIEVGRPYIEELAREIDETVLISRRNGRVAYCIDRVEPTRPVRLQFARGQAMSLDRGSLARVLLAHMPSPDREAYLETIDPALRAKSGEMLSVPGLDRVVREGWTESFEEIDTGIWGTAAAIYGADREVAAAIGTAGPIFRLDEKERADIIRRVRKTAEAISAGLAGRR